MADPSILFLRVPSSSLPHAELRDEKTSDEPLPSTLAFFSPAAHIFFLHLRPFIFATRSINRTRTHTHKLQPLQGATTLSLYFIFSSLLIRLPTIAFLPNFFFPRVQRPAKCHINNPRVSELHTFSVIFRFHLVS